jgi:spore coat protein U-like protein
MQLGSTKLNYNLYSDGARLTVWGDGTGGTSTVSSGPFNLSGSTYNKDYIVYGRIPAQTGLGAGSYLDTVVITLTY